MKQGNVSIFVPHNGCPHQCSFCNQKNIIGQAAQPDADDVRRTLETALTDLKDRSRQTEIAFFGGSFTAIDRDYMLTLLRATEPYIDCFYGIRVSTRPDAVDREVLALLKRFHVTAIELGAQSMDNSVLELNKRGHRAEEVVSASRLIQSEGFSLGLQMMTGLYGATPEKDIGTAEQFIVIHPDTVRVYPTVILRDTALAALYLSGDFTPYTQEVSVSLCARLILMFAHAKIDLIRLGLHYSESLARNRLGDYYHPAFKELCESRIFFDSFLAQAQRLPSKSLTATIHQHSLSKFLGQKKSNLKQFNALGYEVNITFDNTLGKYDLLLTS